MFLKHPEMFGVKNKDFRAYAPTARGLYEKIFYTINK